MKGKINMPAGSIERTNARKEEIINACEKLYQTMSFKDITLKEIGKETSFSRTSIYNYFQTKEEIFLALLKREYDSWIEQLGEAMDSKETMADDEIADVLAGTLDKHRQLLKIMSMNHYDLEENSRMELLVEFKVSYGNALKTVMKMLEKNVKSFIINLEQVDYIDSSGIGALIYICSTIKKMSLKLAIANIHGSVKKVIELTKLMGYFPIANSIEEALLMVNE